MIRRVAVLCALAVTTSCATAAPDPVEEAFRRADAAQRPFATRKAEDFARLEPGYETVVSLLPAGTWGLLIDAFPDRAYARYGPRFERGGDDATATVARWALVRLAERRHRPTLEFFLGRLGSADPYQRGLAVRMVAHAGDPTLTPRLMAVMPEKNKDGEDAELSADILKAAAGARPPDPAVGRILRRLTKDENWFVGDSTRARYSVASATDPVAAATRLLFDDRRETDSLESFEEWLPEFAVRERLVAFAPLLRRRVREEIETYRANDEEAALRPSTPLLPQLDAFWGFRGPFLLAAYRTALRDLGVPLEPEERDWLESQRLLRPPAEVLIEAGVLPR
jgi:hypothetical protein